MGINVSGGGIRIGDGGGSSVGVSSYVSGTKTASGRAPAGSTVTVKVNGTTAGTATADGNGLWTYVFGTEPTTGQTITATAAVTSSGYTLTAGGIVLPVMGGLEAYWDWAGATPLQSKVGGHTLQQGSGSTVTVIDSGGGPTANAISLDGTTDFLVIPEASVGRLNLGANGYNACTVFAWIDRDDTDIGYIAGCWQEDDNNPKRQYGLFIDLPAYGGTEQVCGHVSKTGGPTPGYPFSRDYSSNARWVNNSAWQFVAFTYDGANVRSFLGPIFDLRPSFTDSNAQTYSKNPYLFADGLNGTPCDFTIGAVRLTAGMANFLAGKIGPVGIYNRALSLSEITQLYRSYLASGNPVYLWDFDRQPSANSTPRELGWRSASASAEFSDVSANTNNFGGAIVGARSYLARGTGSAAGPIVGWSGDLDGVLLSEITSVRFLLNSGITNSLLRLVIKTGNAWYATDATFDLATPGVSGSDWSLAVEQNFTFGRQAAKWRDLTFNPGVALSLAGTARTTDIPEGNLQAIGFYSPANPAVALRIDDLKVFAG